MVFAELVCTCPRHVASVSPRAVVVTRVNTVLAQDHFKSCGVRPFVTCGCAKTYAIHRVAVKGLQVEVSAIVYTVDEVVIPFKKTVMSRID